MTKNKIKRVDLDILERVLITLYELGFAKRTIISRNANMSYDKCMRYLDYLEASGFVKHEKDENNFQIYSLTSVGIDMAKKKLLDNLEQKNLLNNFVINSALA
ncbi:winged helix-turn-helix domain-containing protein [Nitrosopumilus sp.]|uniref:winged helix-turn-helix domain-containing protein n=1 Tax=Nitrosopumilus sp. TaxID=2024843 RepID=UPI002630AFFF|nr:winged helix-turn-helix domain-containing protein [Nitrosopumilus sp.]